MSEHLSIVNLNKDEKTSHALGYKFLPNPRKPFRFLVIGSSGSGKSMMIRNLVERQEFGYADYYKQEMFLISETLGMDRCWNALAKRLPKEHVMDRWNDATVRQMMEYSKKTKTGTLWILDDLITSEAMANKRGSLLQKLFVMGRHYKCSLLLTSQKYRAIPSIMRANSTHVAVFAMRNTLEKKSFFEDHDTEGLPEKFELATSQPHGFFFLIKESWKCFANFEEEL